MSPRISRRRAFAAAAAAGLGVPASAQAASKPAVRGGQFENLRVATYNTALHREAEGDLLDDLKSGDDPQIRAVAEVIQINDPDVLLLNAFDHDEDGAGIELLRRNYLEVGQNGRTPVFYPYTFDAPVNSGVDSGLDLDGDGTVGGAEDAWGTGDFPGSGGMVVLSRHPILTEQVRTFQNLLWSDMPSNLLPAESYDAEAAAAVRLSSTSHWDVPVQVGSTVVHVLAAHPASPEGDDEDTRDQRRNNDEIRLWADYLTSGKQSQWITDDDGARGGLDAREKFVILGDYGADPAEVDSWPGAIDQLLSHPRVRDTKPRSAGAVEAATQQGDADADQEAAARFHTAAVDDSSGPVTRRVDYVLPAKSLQVVSSAVYWPEDGSPGSELTGQDPYPTSNHRLVRVDLQVNA